MDGLTARVALIQLEMRDDETPADRISLVEQLVAGLSNADLVVLPELWATGYSRFDAYYDESEPLDGTLTGRLAGLARENGIYFLAGSVVEQRGGRYFNTSLLFDPQGRLIGLYRKVHLFGYDSAESRLLTAGDEIVTVETTLGCIGLTTCYDLRFPELYRELVVRGADILAVVAAWPLERLEHWRVLTRARAIENQCFLMAVNVAGRLGHTRYAGHSVLVDPRGNVLGISGHRPEVLRGELDPRLVAETRRDFPALRDRRPALFDASMRKQRATHHTNFSRGGEHPQ